MPAFVRGAGAACFPVRVWAGLSLLALSGTFACNFPDYRFAKQVGGEGGNAGAGTAGAVGSSAGLGGGGSGGSAGSNNAGADGGVPVCTPQAGAGAGGSAALPAHCSNGKKDSDETGADCGGPTCAVCYHSEPCQHASDCISGVCTASACEQVFELEFLPVAAIRNTDTLQFQLRLTYLGAEPLQLKDVTLRYYFSRMGVADPVVPFATVALLNGTSIAPQTAWNIVRVLPVGNSLVDSYLEISFSTTKVLLSHDVVELTQSIEDGSAAGRPFDQNTHYSFQNVMSYTEENTATVYRAGERMWGVPPTYEVPRQCFYTAVNFGGDTRTADGIAFRAGTDPSVQIAGGTPFNTATSGNGTNTPAPSPSPALLPVLETGISLAPGDSATLEVPNGNYWVYPYVVSAEGADTADLLIQGQTVGTFCAESVGGGAAWAKLGPFAVIVTEGVLVFSSNGGALNLAAVELDAAAR